MILLDKTVLGARAGILAGIIVGLISFALSTVEICKLCLIKTGAGFINENIFLSEGLTLWTVLGWINHLTISMILGVIWVYFLYYTGKDYAIIKGLVLGIIVWMTNYSIVSSILGYLPPAFSPVDLLMLLSYHILFGILTAWYIVRYGNLIPKNES